MSFLKCIRQCTLQVSSRTLRSAEKLKYLRVVFTRGIRQGEEIDARVGKENT